MSAERRHGGEREGGHEVGQMRDPFHSPAPEAHTLADRGTAAGVRPQGGARGGWPSHCSCSGAQIFVHLVM